MNRGSYFELLEGAPSLSFKFEKYSNHERSHTKGYLHADSASPNASENTFSASRLGAVASVQYRRPAGRIPLVAKHTSRVTSDVEFPSAITDMTEAT